MTLQPLELEGTWEEIVAHSDELAGRKVRLTVITAATVISPPGSTPPQNLKFLLN